MKRYFIFLLTLSLIFPALVFSTNLDESTEDLRIIGGGVRVGNSPNTAEGLIDYDGTNPRIYTGGSWRDILREDGSLSYDGAGLLSSTYFSGDGANLTNVGTATATALSCTGRVSEAGGITKGQVVYSSGATDQTALMSLADNTDSTKEHWIGVAAETKSDGQTILIRLSGCLSGINTNAFSDGDLLYLSTGGNLTNVQPTSGSVRVIGICAYKNPSVGIISVGNMHYNYYAVASGEDVDIRMGDSAGSNKVSFENYVDSEVASIDSLGNVSLSGAVNLLTTTATSGLVFQNSARLFHTFKHPTGATAIPTGNNLFVGKTAGNFTMGSGATATYQASNNAGIGKDTLSATTTGFNNIAVGNGVLDATTQGYYHVGIGVDALTNIVDGVKTIGIGQDAGKLAYNSGSNISNTNASQSIFIGYNTMPGNNGESNQIVIGDDARGAGTNSITIGNSSHTATYLKGIVRTPMLRLEDTTSSTTGVVFKGTDRFMHNFHHPTGDTAVPVGGNTFVGVNAGNFTMGSTATETNHGSQNVGVGNSVLGALTTGNRNTSIGYGTSATTTTGADNNVLGFFAFYSSTTGIRNVAIGSQSLFYNTEGNENVAIGHNSQLSSLTANYNTSLGSFTLQNATSGANVAIGNDSLIYTTTGGLNVALGAYSGRYYGSGTDANQTSERSMYIGFDTRASADGNTNEMVFGYSTVGNGSNTATWGNTSITAHYFTGLIYTPGSYANDMNGDTTRDLLINDSGELGYDSSTIRKKTNVYDMEDTSWLYSLRPVNFNYKKKAEDGTYSESDFWPKKKYGLIAEEVEEIAPEFVFYDDKGEVEGVQYRELIPVLLNEIQRLNDRITVLENK